MSTTAFHTRDQLARRFSLSRSTIDNFINFGLLQPIEIGGDMAFAPRAIVTVEIIMKGKSLGFSLYEIKRLLDMHTGLNPFASGGDA